MNIIEQALDLLGDGENWVQGMMVDLGRYGSESPPRYCMAGSLRQVTIPSLHLLDQHAFFELYKARELLRTVIAENFADRVPLHDRGRVELFNDHNDTTFDDVRVVMEKAAIRFEEEQ